MNKLIGQCSKLSSCKLSKCNKLAVKETKTTNILSTKHINAPSCRNCKFSVWDLTNVSKNYQHVDLKCIKFPRISNKLGAGVVYPNAFDCRLDNTKCGLEGQFYEPVNVPY